MLAKYPTLTEAEVKTLVVEDKWLGTIATDIHGEMDRISQALTQRGTELAERYEIPLPLAVSKVGAFEQKVPSPREDGVRMVAVTGNSCPRGYKQTEVGKIPADWKVARLRMFTTIQGGFAFSSSTFRESGKYQVVKMSNLHGEILNLTRSQSFLNELNEPGKQYLLHQNDIIITLTGTILLTTRTCSRRSRKPSPSTPPNSITVTEVRSRGFCCMTG